jgi:hypothetical protein
MVSGMSIQRPLHDFGRYPFLSSLRNLTNRMPNNALSALVLHNFNHPIIGFPKENQTAKK